MRIDTSSATSFWRFMDGLSALAGFTGRQWELIERAAAEHRGERLHVTPRPPAEAQVAAACQCLASGMSRGEAAAALRARFGIRSTASFKRVREALDRLRPSVPGGRPDYDYERVALALADANPTPAAESAIN